MSNHLIKDDVDYRGAIEIGEGLEIEQRADGVNKLKVSGASAAPSGGALNIRFYKGGASFDDADSLGSVVVPRCKLVGARIINAPPLPSGSDLLSIAVYHISHAEYGFVAPHFIGYCDLGPGAGDDAIIVPWFEIMDPAELDMPDKEIILFKASGSSTAFDVLFTLFIDPPDEEE